MAGLFLDFAWYFITSHPRPSYGQHAYGPREASQAIHFGCQCTFAAEVGAVEQTRQTTNDQDAAPPDGEVMIRIGYEQLSTFGGTTYYHTLIEVVGPDGDVFPLSAGPSEDLNGGPVSHIIEDGLSNASGATISGHGGTLYVSFGSDAEAEAKQPDIIWKNAGYVKGTYAEVSLKLLQFAAQVNSASLSYWPLTVNCNAFAAQAITSLGLPRPVSNLYWTPGSQVVLPIH